jgi:tRNA threonylcarbamoyladenosine biosynthesis protein TsaE
LRAVWELPAAADTVRLGAALGQALAWGEQGPRLIFLSGELGAGKTTLAAAMLEALGATETVRSPSYALVETYALRGGLGVHVDCYRLADAQEFEQLGLRDYFAPRTLWLVEWPERAGAALPPPDLSVSLRTESLGRLAEIEAMGAAGAAWLALLQDRRAASELK